MRFGACVTIDDIAKAKELGYDYVELSAIEISAIKDEDWPSIKDKILTIGSIVNGFNSFADASHPLVGHDFDLDSLISYTERLVLRGHDLNIKAIGIGAPSARILPFDLEYDAALDQMRSFLIAASNIARPYGIKILLEALHPHMCNFITSTKEAYETIEDLPDDIGLVYDVYHALNNDERLEDSEPYFKKVYHTHISSWDKDRERFFLKADDKELIDDTLRYFRSIGYDDTLSIEASHESFMLYGDISIRSLKEREDII